MGGGEKTAAGKAVQGKCRIKRNAQGPQHCSHEAAGCLGFILEQRWEIPPRLAGPASG